MECCHKFSKTKWSGSYSSIGHDIRRQCERCGMWRRGVTSPAAPHMCIISERPPNGSKYSQEIKYYIERQDELFVFLETLQ